MCVAAAEAVGDRLRAQRSGTPGREGDAGVTAGVTGLQRFYWWIDMAESVK